MDTVPVALLVILGVFALVFLVVYALAPLKLYAINTKLAETNRLLGQLVAQSSQQPQSQAPPPSAEPAQGDTPMFHTLG